MPMNFRRLCLPVLVTLLAACGGGGAERRDSLDVGASKVTVRAIVSVNAMPQIVPDPGMPRSAEPDCLPLYVGGVFTANPPPFPAAAVASMTLEDDRGTVLWSSPVTVADEQPWLAEGVLSAYARGCAPAAVLVDRMMTAVFEIRTDAGSWLLVAPPARLQFLS